MKRGLSDDEDTIPCKVTKCEVNNYGRNFRQKLKTPDALTFLRAFSETGQELAVVKEYIEAGGGVKEFLELLNRLDGKNNHDVAEVIISAICCVVEKVTTELLLNQKVTEEACDVLLSSYMKTLLNMLTNTSSKTSHKRVVLKLFTNMSELSGPLAKKILNSFPTNPKLYRILSGTSDKLRVQFIQFILSFLIDGDELLSTELLQKKGLLYSIFPDIMNDPPELIVLVLNILDKKVVNNPKISKTVKLHAFNTSVVRLIATLLDYNTDVTEHTSEANKATNVNVIDSAFQLLYTLCTSHKLGILFREQIPTGNRKNELILTLLEDISEPHKNKMKARLISEILKICPEFFKNIVAKLEVNFRIPDPDNITKLIDFLIEINRRSLIYESEGVDEHHALVFINSVIFSPGVRNIFVKYFNEDAVHSNPINRYQAFRLLLNILEKIEHVKFMYTKSKADVRRIDYFNVQLEQFLTKVVIPVKKLAKAWKLGVNYALQESVTDIDHTELVISDNYFFTLTELLLLYKNMIPVSFNELRTFESVDFYEKTLTTDDEKLKFNLARLIFYVHNPKPTEPKFEVMMKQLIRFYIRMNNAEANTIVRDVLKHTIVFERYEDEINVWLCCMKKSNENVTLIVDLFVQSLRISAQNNKYYFQSVATLNKGVPSTKDLFGDDCDWTLPEEIENSEDVSNLSEVLTKPAVAISTMVLAFLDELKALKLNQLQEDEKIAVGDFYSSLALGLLHLQHRVQPLFRILNEHSRKNLLKPDILPFISFWANRDDGEINHGDSYPDYPISSENLEARCYSKFFDESYLGYDDFCGATNEELTLFWDLMIFYISHIGSPLSLSNGENMIRAISSVLPPEIRFTLLKRLLTNHYFIEKYAIDNNNLGKILYLLPQLTECRNSTSTLDLMSLKSPFRYKFLKTILFGLRRKEPLKSTSLGIGQIEFLQLSDPTIAYLLDELISLPVQLFICEETNNSSAWMELVERLIDETVHRLKSLEHKNLMSLIKKVIEIFKLTSKSYNIECTISQYIHSFPHHANLISDELISDLMLYKPKNGKNTLVNCLICTKSVLSSSLQNQFVKSVISMEMIQFDKLLYVLNKAKLSEERVQELLKHICKIHFKDVINLLYPDSLLFTENMGEWTEKILRQIDEPKCVAICDKIIKHWNEFELTSKTYSVISVIFEKATKTELMVHKIMKQICKKLGEEKNVDWLMDAIGNTVNPLEDLSSLQLRSFWNEFVKMSLKRSLHTDNSTILRNFRIVCERALNESSKENAGLIFQMTVSHSEFVNRMMNNSNVKCELIKLLMVLTKVDTTVMASNHLPLLLASYKATLSECDQLLLQLLYRYEDNKVRFTDCRPYLWGQAAANHHSIRTGMSVSLRRHPSPNQVLELLDINIIKNTVKNYPLSRRLQPDICEYSLDSDVYDLCFILPLMSHLLAAESRISVQKFTRSGALCLILTSLSCEDENVRISGYHCLQRFHSHLFSQEKEVQIWKQFTEALKNGLSAEDNDSDGKEIPILPCLVTTFLSYMSLIISEPLHTLYSPLLNFLLAKPCFDLESIPNFFMLFFSNDLRHREHQEWILKVIRDGLRFKKDWVVAQKCFMFKFLQQYYLSSLSNGSVNLLILQILAKALKIDECKVYLVTKCGLFSWISHVLRHDTFNQSHHLPIILELLKSLITAKNSKNVLFRTILLAQKLKASNIEESILSNLLQVVSEAYSLCKMKNVLEENIIKLFIDLAGLHLDERSWTIFNNNLKFKSDAGLNEFCDNKVQVHIARILKIFSKNM